MSSDDYQVQNVYRYCRKSYKKNRRPDDSGSPREDVEAADLSPRSGVRSHGVAVAADPLPGCSCNIDPEGDIANILHKKCPVISLAQQQLQRLLDGTDKLLCDNTRCCRSLYDFLCICKEVVLSQNRYQCILVIMIAAAFFTGLLIGAASCGSYLRQFNSPILSCIDNFFIPDAYPTIEETYRCIA